jgi:cytochrome c556
VALGLIAALVISAYGAQAAGPVKRARPPKFSKAVTDAFLPDAREKLVGSRPQWSVAGSTPSTVNESQPSAPAEQATESDWSGLIAAEAIEDEIKLQARALGGAVENPLKFKAGEYQNARLHLSVLAAMFAIDAEYGQRVRWQRDAAAIRDRVARAGFNCKVGTDASYQEAKARFDDLETLVRGGTIDAQPPAADASWPRIADRSLLMKRLEQALEEKLKPGVADSSAFSASADEMAHDVQVIAALAAVIACEGYEFADDESYLELATAMRTHAVAARAALAEGNYESARQAVGEIGKSCASCHESYRN